MKDYTTSLNEYIYFVSFLYPEYMTPAIKAVKEGDDSWQQTTQLIARRGIHLSTKPFKNLINEMLKNLYVHATTKEDIRQEALMQDDQTFVGKVKEKLNNQLLQAQEEEVTDHTEITYLSDIKKQVNFSFMQSMALIAAYIAGMNKESSDIKLFDKSQQKHRQQQQPQKEQFNRKEQRHLMVGRSKRFSTDRFLAILHYFLLLTAEETKETKLVGHSLDTLATLNSLAEEGLLKKSVAKKSDSNLDDLCAVAFKCNFDENFVKDVAKKVNFNVDEYLILDNKEE